MPRHLISDAHEWINEIPTVPIYYLAKPQPRERAWQNQRGKKTLGAAQWGPQVGRAHARHILVTNDRHKVSGLGNACSMATPRHSQPNVLTHARTPPAISLVMVRANPRREPAAVDIPTSGPYPWLVHQWLSLTLARHCEKT